MQPEVDEINESPQNSPSPRRTRSLQDIYDQTEEIDAANQVFFAFFAGEDPISYEKKRQRKRIGFKL